MMFPLIRFRSNLHNKSLNNHLYSSNTRNTSRFSRHHKARCKDHFQQFQKCLKYKELWTSNNRWTQGYNSFKTYNNNSNPNSNNSSQTRCLKHQCMTPWLEASLSEWLRLCHLPVLISSSPKLRCMANNRWWHHSICQCPTCPLSWHKKVCQQQHSNQMLLLILCNNSWNNFIELIDCLQSKRWKQFHWLLPMDLFSISLYKLFLIWYI